MGPKIDQKSIPKSIKKMMPKKTDKNLKNRPWVGGFHGRVENMRSGADPLILSIKDKIPGTKGN